jgi:methionyl-tRNA formyltransferase
MVEKADRGDIVAQRRISIASDDTSLTLHRRATHAARLLMREAYPLLAAGRAPRVAQDSSAASYYGRRTPADGEIDWSRPAKRIYDLVRAVTHPYPGAFTWHHGRRLFIWWARIADSSRPVATGEVEVTSSGEVYVGTGQGALRLERVQPEGSAETSAAEWAARDAGRTREILGKLQ